MKRYGCFARVTCEPLLKAEAAATHAQLLETPIALSKLLERGFPEWQVTQFLHEIEAGDVQQLTITDAIARRLGFVQILQ